MEKLITIAMPVYNCEKYIGFAIKSILNQSYINWELIIIDDNSTDKTVAKIKEFNDSRIILYNNYQNEGLAACLNKCIDLSKGEYFARMDGDDIMISNRLESQLNFLDKNLVIDVVGGLAYNINENNKILGIKRTIKPNNLNEVINLRGYFIHPTVMGRTKWFKQNNYDVSIKRCQDFELWVRTFINSRFYIMEEFFIFYREIDSIYRKKYFDAFVNIKMILKIHRNKINTVQYYSIITKAYLKYFFYDLAKLLGVLNLSNNTEDLKLENIQELLSKQI